MGQLDEIMEYNQAFIDNKEYEPYMTSGLPKKKMVVFTCMDTRLTELLPRAMNLKNGDAKIIKNAGAIITDPNGSIMRSIVVALYALTAEEVYVVGHHRCGMSHMDTDKAISTMKIRGITDAKIKEFEAGGKSLADWLTGFDSVETSVENTVQMIKNHPMIGDNIKVHGLVIDPDTGALDLVHKDE